VDYVLYREKEKIERDIALDELSKFNIANVRFCLKTRVAFKWW